MIKEKGIVIICPEAGSIGKEAAIVLSNRSTVSALVSNRINFLTKPDPLNIRITPRISMIEEEWIDPDEPVVNYRKHDATCLKNRKARRKKKRRK